MDSKTARPVARNNGMVGVRRPIDGRSPHRHHPSHGPKEDGIIPQGPDTPHLRHKAVGLMVGEDPVHHRRNLGRRDLIAVKAEQLPRKNRGHCCTAAPLRWFHSSKIC